MKIYINGVPLNVWPVGLRGYQTADSEIEDVDYEEIKTTNDEENTKDD